MNWFGLFTMAMIIVLVVWGLAYGYGYEQAEKDMHMSRQWVMRNHPTNTNNSTNNSYLGGEWELDPKTWELKEWN